MAAYVRDGQPDEVRAGVTPEGKHKPIIKRSVYGWWTKNGQFHGRDSAYPRGLNNDPPKGAPSDQWERWCYWVHNHIQTNNEGELINMRTLTIELRFDADEEDKHEVLKEAAKAAAKHLYTNALLISTKRKPQIAMYTSDMFAGQEEITLADDLE